MANGQLDSVLQHIRKLVAAERTATIADRELLERFIQHRDEAAFAMLVQRHGPMVMTVCRRGLGHVHDAEDACQATFLVLARKAASIRKRDSIASWLHGVAYHAAANLKREVSRRHAHEQPSVDVPQEPADITWREVRIVLDEELQRLPRRFQAPLLLCYLEGKTRDEAARELGWSIGTIRGRLQRGRELLRSRLIRRGLTLSAALLASMLAENAVAVTLPATLVVQIAKAAGLVVTGQGAATGIISARVIALMEGGLKAMWMTKLKIVTAAWVALGLAGMGAGMLTKEMLAAQPADAPRATPMNASRHEADQRKPHEETVAADGRRQQPNDPLQSAKNQAESRRNLQKLALAMHNYQSTFNHLPAPAFYSDSPRAPFDPFVTRTVSTHGKALLSWRVALLPYLERESLYNEFKLDEPWDSPHNKKLLPRMPKVYAPPGMTTREPYSTFYQVFVGTHAAFEHHHNGISLGDFLNSPSHVLLIVEAGCAVPWTKPEDLHFALDQPIPELGGQFPGMFNAAMADGSIWPLSKKMDSDTLRKLIVRDNDQSVNASKFRIPVSSRETELRRHNEQLSEEVKREQARLEGLRRAKNALKEMAEDPAIDPLKNGNAHLEQLLRQLREENERLNREIQRLKQDLEKPPSEAEKK